MLSVSGLNVAHIVDSIMLGDHLIWIPAERG